MRKLLIVALMLAVAELGYVAWDRLPAELASCKPTNRWAYARSPFPDEYRWELKRDIASDLRDGCFDGRRWTNAEIQTALQ